MHSNLILTRNGITPARIKRTYFRHLETDAMNANTLSRRKFLSAMALMPLPAYIPSVLATSGAGSRQPGSKTLVAYFSRTGNTRMIAGQIHRARGADLFEIQPATPHP